LSNGRKITRIVWSNPLSPKSWLTTKNNILKRMENDGRSTRRRKRKQQWKRREVLGKKGMRNPW
jgi:hypothetical protein